MVALLIPSQSLIGFAHDYFQLTQHLIRQRWYFMSIKYRYRLRCGLRHERPLSPGFPHLTPAFAFSQLQVKQLTIMERF